MVAVCMLKSGLVASDFDGLLDICNMDMKKCKRKILDAIWYLKEEALCVRV